MVGEKEKNTINQKRLRFLDYLGMIDRELIHELIKKKSELFAYSFQIKTGSLKKTHFIKIIKREIAWLFTILRQRKINVHDHFSVLTKDYVRKIAEKYIANKKEEKKEKPNKKKSVDKNTPKQKTNALTKWKKEIGATKRTRTKTKNQDSNRGSIIAKESTNKGTVFSDESGKHKKINQKIEKRKIIKETKRH